MAYIKKKYQSRIDEIYRDSDGWWIYLKRGYCWDDKGLHTIHEDTQKEAIECLYYTEKCDCDYCKGLEN
jgi:hypothetical protein